MSPRPIVLVYDGDCAFCVRCLRVIQMLDLFGACRYVNGRDRALVADAYPMLRDADLDHAMYAVDSRDRTFRGFFAFRRLARVSPLMWIFLPILYFPGSSIAGPAAYDWISRNRSALGCVSSCSAAPRSPRPPSDPTAPRGR